MQPEPFPVPPPDGYRVELVVTATNDAPVLHTAVCESMAAAHQFLDWVVAGRVPPNV